MALSVAAHRKAKRRRRRVENFRSRERASRDVSFISRVFEEERAHTRSSAYVFERQQTSAHSVFAVKIEH
ncbi:MAG: hypothetical protein C4334_13030 [Pyrinomonas sp.]